MVPLPGPGMASHIMDKTNSLIIGSLERLFHWWGLVVTRHPYPVILTATTLTALASLGFLVFRSGSAARAGSMHSQSAETVC